MKMKKRNTAIIFNLRQRFAAHFSGHKSSRTTEIYTHITSTAKSKIISPPAGGQFGFR